MRLSNDNIRLLPFEPQFHAPHVYRWNHSGEYQMFFGNSEPVTMARATELRNAYMIVNAHKPDEVIGLIVLSAIKERHRNLEIRGLVDNAHQRKGMFNEAFILMCNYVMNSMNFYKIIGTPREDNEKSIGLLEKAGFKTEGVMENEIYVDGEFHNVKRYAITKGAFNKLHKAGLSAPKSEEV